MPNLRSGAFQTIVSNARLSFTKSITTDFSSKDIHRSSFSLKKENVLI